MLEQFGQKVIMIICYFATYWFIAFSRMSRKKQRKISRGLGGACTLTLHHFYFNSCIFFFTIPNTRKLILFSPSRCLFFHSRKNCMDPFYQHSLLFLGTWLFFEKAFLSTQFWNHRTLILCEIKLAFTPNTLTVSIIYTRRVNDEFPSQ